MKVKGEISYSGKKVFVGIDVHRRSYVTTAICNGAVVKRCRMEADAEKLCVYLERHFSSAKVYTVYEAGFSGFALHRHLESVGVNNIVINAASLEVSPKDRVKTDKRDSKKLAQQLSVGVLTGIRIPTLNEEVKRQYSRTRQQLLGHRKRCMNQIRMKLHQFGLFPIEHRGVLSIKFVESVLEAPVPPELQDSIEMLLSVWKCLNCKVLEINKQLRLQAKDDEYEKIYRSIPGVGPVSSRILSTELGDMSQFSNEVSLFSFTGLTPSENSSGESRRLGHITRQGSARLRFILTECAWVAIKKDPGLREDFERIAVRAGKKRAIVAIARKLIGRARALFRKGEMYKVQCKLAA